MTFSDTILVLVWPMTAILCAVILRKFADDARTVVKWTVETAVKTGGTIDVMFIVIVFGLGLQAFGTGFYDNFWPIEPSDWVKLGWWQRLAAFLKSGSFAIGIMVGYALNPRNGSKSGSTTVSTTETKTVSEPSKNP